MDPTLIPIPVNAPGVLEFNQQRDLIWILEQVVILAVPLALLFTGWAARLRTMCARITGDRSWLTLILFAAAYLAIAAITVLPVAWWREIAHREAWSRPAEALGPWLANRGIGLVIQIVVAALLLWIPFAFIRRMPRWWWLPAAAIAWVAISFAITAEQVWVRPMVTDTRSFPEGPLKDRFNAIAARCNAGNVPMFITDEDVGGTVYGVGPTSRIVFNEEILTKPEGEVAVTFAHELKHYLMNDNWLAFGVLAVLLLVGAALARFVGGAAIARFGPRFGFTSLADPASLPLMIFILTFAWIFVGTPTLNLVQQNVENEASRFSFEVTRDSHSDAERLTREGDPLGVAEYYWFFRVFRATHPSVADTARLANTWRPWETGQPGRYDAVCAPP
jgi:STE24 endopeptidase